MLLTSAVALLIVALLLVLLHRYRRVRGGLPVGELIYSDDVSAESPVLISTRYGLKGRPDALIRTKSGEIIPLERKSSRAPQRPYDGDLIQAAAYCVLVQEQYGSRPPCMRIHYQADALMNHLHSSVNGGFTEMRTDSSRETVWTGSPVPPKPC